MFATFAFIKLPKHCASVLFWMLLSLINMTPYQTLELEFNVKIMDVNKLKIIGS